MEFLDCIHALKKELINPLPGRRAQLAMSSMQRIHELIDFTGQKKARNSSVLIFLYPSFPSVRVKMVLILRPSYNGIHGGQISLPGGKHELSDADMSVTALRETKEEIGIDSGEVSIIGELSTLYIPPSNYIVYPFVGFSSRVPGFTPHPKEVEKIIEIHLEDLLDEKNIRKKKISLKNGIHILAPCFVIDGNIIWGATAMILNEFREVLKKIYRIPEESEAIS